MAHAMSPTVRPTGWPAGCGAPALSAGEAVHLVGIGGAGMQALAWALLARGLRVSGSDRASSPALAVLSDAGATVHAGHDAAHLPVDASLVIVSPAVPADNAEVAAAVAAGVPVVKGKQLLGALVDAGRGVGVSGTHGKTTTTGLIGHIVRRAGIDASVFVGADVPDLGGSAVIGASDVVIYEADEYDRSFLFGRPRIAVITNIEHDHPDIYPALGDVVDAFGAFARSVPADGRIVAVAGSPAVDQALAGAAAPVERYRVVIARSADGGAGGAEDGNGVGGDGSSEADGPTAAWTARVLDAGPSGQRFDVTHDGAHLGRFATRLSGAHNVANALAAIAAAHELGIDVEAIRAAVADYRGADRRFEVVAEVGGVTVIDDYAHHPTEITATLDAARSRYPGRRIWAIFQPHTYSRVALLADAFAAALRAADRVVLLPVYGARESGGAHGAEAIAAGVRATIVDGLAAAADVAAREAVAGDVLLFMGAGDIPLARHAAVRGLAARAAAAVVAAARDAGLGGDVLGGSPLADYTSLKVGGPADVAVRVRSLSDLRGWWLLSWRLGAPVRVLGRGSNVLIADRGLPGVALINRCEGWRLVADDGGDVDAEGEPAVPADDAATARVVAEGGVTLAALSQQLARLGWAGVEASVGIPGSVGAAVVTNAGAHGWAMADSLRWAEVVDATGAVGRMDGAALRFGYRSSALKGDGRRLVTRAVLEVRRDEPQAILDRIAALSAARRRTQPTTPSVGSVFKNPVGDFAGRLLEHAGMKGRHVGAARVSHVHANFFVNEGGARAADMRALIETARRAVLADSGVRLELEIEALGDDDEALV